MRDEYEATIDGFLSGDSVPAHELKDAVAWLLHCSQHLEAQMILIERIQMMGLDKTPELVKLAAVPPREDSGLDIFIED